MLGTTVLDRYRVEAELGAGAMGTVYRARHVRVGRTVAIKVLHPHMRRESERFEREARLAARLHHTNVAAVVDLEDGMMVMEHAPGRPLADLVGTPMSRARAIAIVRQILAGLDHAHAMGLVHRDLKPENIMIDDDRVCIVDWGIAVLRDGCDDDTRRLTTAGLVLGTPMYMAPEQARGERVDERCDLFALGVIVYELLAGVGPFEGGGLDVIVANLTQEPPSIATRAGVDVDPALEAFARRLMAHRADDRFASAHAALLALDCIAAAPWVPAPVEVETTARFQRPQPRRSSWGNLVAAAVGWLHR
ncbi:MAG TPA: serine/threonine-protein kinase [Kofleriaceae bacterium]|nr:serine/threonine-protein kinase [Kofleriaceae bacterium]